MNPTTPPASAVCPNCGQPGNHRANPTATIIGGYYTCQPKPPESETETPTPETDAVKFDADKAFGDEYADVHECVPADFARALELSRNAALARLAAVEGDVKRLNQLKTNEQWLISQFDKIHESLCPEQFGTWQQKVEQVVEEALHLKAYKEHWVQQCDRLQEAYSDHLTELAEWREEKLTAISQLHADLQRLAAENEGLRKERDKARESKRPFSDALAEKVIAGQVERIKELEAKLAARNPTP